MTNMEPNKGEIVMYQPDETIRLEVRMDGETVWLSQAQMAELFGTKRQAITKHLQNIYECAELKRDTTSSILELVRKEGIRTVKRKIEYYNLGLWFPFIASIPPIGFRGNGPDTKKRKPLTSVSLFSSLGNRSKTPNLPPGASLPP